MLATAAYLKETGDRSILDEAVPYDNAAGSEAPLYDHLRRSLEYTLARLGPHGLPLIGRADWNDCLNLNTFSTEPGESFQTTANRTGGAAESVFIAALFLIAAHELEAIACLRGDDALAARCRSRRPTSMAAATATHGWDGAWYRRAYDYDGQPGRLVAATTRARSSSSPRAWRHGRPRARGRAGARRRSRRSGSGSRRRTGSCCVQPAFTRYHVELGEITSYPPGYKENGAVFCHTNPWLMIGEAITGNADGALDYYLRINPSAREAISDVHRTEPYVYAQMIAGRDAPTEGEAKNSWLTGTAAWNFVAISQWILGIRPEHDGLRVEPALPAAWPGFRATRRFRGTAYEIDVRRAGSPAAGTAPPRSRCSSTARPIDGTVVPLAPAGTPAVRVEVLVS